MSLPNPSQSVSHKQFHQCVNHKKKLSSRPPLPTLGSFSFFQASLWLGVDKLLKKLTKSYKSDLRHLFQWSILIPRKCLRKNQFQQTGGGGGGGGGLKPHHFSPLTQSWLWYVVLTGERELEEKKKAFRDPSRRSHLLVSFEVRGCYYCCFLPSSIARMQH